MNLAFQSIKDIKEKLNKKEISSYELLDFYIKRFEKYDKEINSSIEIFSKESIINTTANKIKSNYNDNYMSSIPGFIKDNILQEGRYLSCASKILKDYKATYNATAVENLLENGSYLIGRANLDEFAMGSSCETSYFGPVKNPWDLERVPGGSSGGSAAAVAAGLIPWALGSETGGSVRQPAALCSIVGLKPTYGLVSRYGLVAYGSSLDCIGTFTKYVWDNAAVLSIIAGHDSKDSTSLNIKKQDYTQGLNGKLPENFTLGIIKNSIEKDGFDNEVLKALYEAIKEFERLGAKIKYINLPTLDYSAATYFMISRAEAASNLARFDGVRYGFRSSDESLQDLYKKTRKDGFGFEVKSRILIGNYVLSAGYSEKYYKNANIVRELIKEEFKNAFKEVNLLFSPVSPIPAFKLGQFAKNKLEMDLQDYFTASMNLAGIPAISIPCGFTSNKLPIGLQLIGPENSENLLYKVAYAYEQNTKWHTIIPEKYKN